MAINWYDRKETIHFNPEKPVEYYSWYVSSSADDINIGSFSSVERRDEYLRKASAMVQDPDVDSDLLAIVALGFVRHDGGISCREDIDFWSRGDRALISDETWDELLVLANDYV